MWKNYVFETREDALKASAMLSSLLYNGGLDKKVVYFGVGNPTDTDATEEYIRTLSIKFKD